MIPVDGSTACDAHAPFPRPNCDDCTRREFDRIEDDGRMLEWRETAVRARLGDVAWSSLTTPSGDVGVAILELGADPLERIAGLQLVPEPRAPGVWRTCVAGAEVLVYVPPARWAEVLVYLNWPPRWPK